MTPISTNVTLLLSSIGLGLVLSAANPVLDHASATKVSLLQRQLTASVQTFVDRYGFLPGDLPDAINQFGSNGKNGDGNGAMTPGKAQTAWAQLAASGLVEDSLPKIRGVDQIGLTAVDGQLALSLKGTRPAVKEELQRIYSASFRYSLIPNQQMLLLTVN